MKASDYIVQFLINKGIRDVFGYPGGMVTHFMDSLEKYNDQITAHLNYHEQASAMAACAWAEISGKPGVAYATSGPGATNLITGICCAYFDSVPCIFITGQVNTYEQKGHLQVRQKGFQETDIVTITRTVCKKTYSIKNGVELIAALNDAYRVCQEGRPGPVLLDIPMNVLREDVTSSQNTDVAQSYNMESLNSNVEMIITHLRNAKRPVIIAGHGIDLSKQRKTFLRMVNVLKIPVVTSMLGVDTIPYENPYNFNMIGAYGRRWSNYIVDYSDCILSLGTRLDCRQTGVNRNAFAPNAKILRVDIDENELKNCVHEGQIDICADLKYLIPKILQDVDFTGGEKWFEACKQIKSALLKTDCEPANNFICALSKYIPSNAVVTSDVGQNQVWTAQSIELQKENRLITSGGHGAMGYALPASIGASIASNRMVICVTGDGGLQMNLQELETIKRENLNIKIFVLNNEALGMIHHFQEMYFDGRYMQTQASTGYTTPNFCKIAQAYGIETIECTSIEQIKKAMSSPCAILINVKLPTVTHVFPKLGMNKPIHQQEPPLNTMKLLEVDQILKEVGALK